MERSSLSLYCSSPYYFDNKGPKLFEIITKDSSNFHTSLIKSDYSTVYSLERAKEIFRLFLLSNVVDELEAVPLLGRVEEVEEVEEVEDVLKCFDFKNKTIEEILEASENDPNVAKFISDIALSLGMDKQTFMETIDAETIIGMAAYSTATPSVIQGTSWRAIASQYLAVNLVSNSVSAALATINLPVLDATAEVVSNVIFKTGLVCLGAKISETVYNLLVAKTPLKEISLDLSQLAPEFINSQLGLSKNENEQVKIESKPKFEAKVNKK